MTLVNAPAIVTQLSTQLAACASWAGGTGACWYPRVVWASASLPLAILEESEAAFTPYAAGCSGLASGALKLTIHSASSSDDGTVETLGRAILSQLLAQQSGIIWRTSECGLSGTFSSAEAATDTATIAIILTLGYGLNS